MKRRTLLLVSGVVLLPLAGLAQTPGKVARVGFLASEGLRPRLGALRQGLRDHGYVDAIDARNYPVLQGGILFIAFVFVIVNLVVDVSYGFLNPRIRLS